MLMKISACKFNRGFPSLAFYNRDKKDKEIELLHQGQKFYFHLINPDLIMNLLLIRDFRCMLTDVKIVFFFFYFILDISTDLITYFMLCIFNGWKAWQYILKSALLPAYYTINKQYWYFGKHILTFPSHIMLYLAQLLI